MKKLLLLFVVFTFTAIGQLNFNPLYNLSNTSYATSDYHSVYPSDIWYGPMQNFYVVWGDNGQIKFKRSTDGGITWSPNKTISATENTCGWPVVVADQYYQTIVVFYHTLISGNYHLIYQRSTDGGSTWSPMQALSTGNAITPQLAFDGVSMYVVWEERIGSNYEILFCRSDDLGSTWWVTPKNISNTPTSSRWVQLKSSGLNLYCTWIEGTTYPLSDIYFTKSTDGGYSWTTPVNITNDARPQNRVYMHVDQDKIYLACDDIPGAFNYDEIYLIKSLDGGHTWSDAVNITNNPGHSNTPCLVTAFDQIYFTWADNSHTAPSFNNMDIFFKRSTDGGVTWLDSLNLSNNPESSSRPRICLTLNGTIEDPYVSMSVIWYDYSFGAAEILARNGTHLNIPVELISFNAEAEGNSVNLRWLTATEINNKGFDIERKQEGNWESITFIPGHGTTTEPKHYFYSDKNLSAGNYTYRLRQTDYDGTYEYSDEVNISVEYIYSFNLTQNYPNPFNPVTKIKYNIGKAGRVSLSVYDLLGNEIALLLNEEKSPGSYETDFDGSSLASGTYIYRLRSGGETLSRKLILLK
jgi:hypothetical protein